METSSDGTNLKAGTAGGTLFVLITQLKWDEVEKSIVLALIGAIVSYVVSAGMRWMGRRMGK